MQAVCGTEQTGGRRGRLVGGWLQEQGRGDWQAAGNWSSRLRQKKYITVFECYSSLVLIDLVVLSYLGAGEGLSNTWQRTGGG